MKIFFIFAILISSAFSQDVFFPGDDEEEKEVKVTAKCATIGGPSAGKDCVIPFKIGDVVFNGCTRFKYPTEPPWCSVKVDATGQHVDNGGHWGYCDMDNCDEVEVDIEAGDENEGSVVRTASKLEAAEEFERCLTTKGVEGFCRPSSLCIGLTDEEEDANLCDFNGDVGVCCADRESNDGSVLNLGNNEDDEEAPQVDNVSVADVEKFIIGSRFGPVTSPVVNDANDQVVFGGDNDVNDEDQDDLADLEPLNFHLKFNAPSEAAKNVDESAKNLLQAAENIQNENSLSAQQAGIGLRMFNSVNSKSIREMCPWNNPVPKCDGSQKYRNHDGTCNNLKEPSFGRAITPYQRIILPQYSKGNK